MMMMIAMSMLKMKMRVIKVAWHKSNEGLVDGESSCGPESDVT
jgi:hypothetical protein